MKLLKDKRFYMFLIPSLIGAFLFVTPIQYDGNLTIPIAIAANFMLDLMGDYALTVIWLLISLSAVVTIVHKLRPLSILKRNEKLDALFSVCKSRSELVATFLSILELCSGGTIFVTGTYGDYQVSHAGRGE